MYSTILYATDLSESSISVFKKAVQMAAAFSAQLYLLHVIEMPSTMQYAHALGFAELKNPNKEEAQIVLNTLAQQENIAEELQLVEVGDPKTKILETAANIACDLIIIGHHDKSEGNPLLGNVALEIVKNAAIDVLTLHKN